MMVVGKIFNPTLDLINNYSNKKVIGWCNHTYMFLELNRSMLVFWTSLYEVEICVMCDVFDKIFGIDCYRTRALTCR